MKKVILKKLSSILGLLFIVSGVFLIFVPIFETLLEKINAVAFMITGIFFIAYVVRKQ